MIKQKTPQKIIITTAQTAISAGDRGFNYGDGFFTTAKILDGEVEHWPLHRQRLSECSERLLFGELDFPALERTISTTVSEQPTGILKIVVTRGEGGRGYGLPEQPKLKILLSLLPFPAGYPELPKRGITLGVSPIKLASQPLFAGLKTLNRLEQVMIKQAMQQQPYDDVVVCDYNGYVIETSAANIFAIKGGRIVSPQLQNCGIKGVYLQSLCAKLPIEFIDITLEQLQRMDAVFMCNSLMGVVPVTAIGDIQFQLAPSSLLLQELFAKEPTC